MKINDNIPALQSYTSLLQTNRKISESMSRLSSGLRINSVSDDAAGMSISNKLKMQLGGLEIASRNAMDGISLIQTGEGALQEVHNMLQRVRELAVQSANGTNEPGDRAKINDEIHQLLQEIDDTAYKTEFNNIKMLNGDAARLAKIPVSDRIYTDVNFVSDSVPTGQLSYKVDKLGLPANIISGSGSFTNIAALVGQTMTINGDSITVSADDTPATLVEKIQGLCEINDFEIEPLNGATWDNYENGAATLIIYTKTAGSNQHIDIKGSPALLSAFGFSSAGVSAKGSDAVVSATTIAGEQLSWVASGNSVTLRGTNSKQIDLEFKIGGPASDGTFYTMNTTGANTIASATGIPANPRFATSMTVDMLDFGMIKLQIGANKNMTLDVQIPDLSAKGLGIEHLHAKSVEGARNAIVVADEAISKVSSARSKLGAYQNRLQHTYENLDATHENTSTALSRIYDADMAWEMTQLTQANIIEQAAMSVLAQANQRPQQILQLLR